MCGLIGVITAFKSGLYQPEIDTFNQLLFFDVLRGDDATGIALIEQDGEISILKEAKASPIMMTRPLYTTIMQKAKGYKGKALLGHNRKSTVGGDIDGNAHPFVLQKNQVFFHNGTIKNHKVIENTEVDSIALGNILTKCNGSTTEIEEALSKVDGAYACVWYDQNKHTIFFLRNNERPLFIGKTKLNTYIYASEEWMLAGISERNNQKLEKIINVVPDCLYSLDLNLISTDLVLKEQQLTIKKEKSQSHYSRSSGTHKQQERSNSVSISKKYAHHLAATLLKKGAVVTFNIDDYLEEEVNVTHNLPEWVSAKYVIWGHNKQETPGCLYKGSIFTSEYSLMTAWNNNSVVTGVVDDTYYDKDDKTLIVNLINIEIKEPNEATITH